MPEELDQRIRHMLQEVDAAAAPHELPGTRQVWSQLQFRLRYRPRRTTDAFQGSFIFVAIYLLVLLMWNTQFAWLNLSLAIVLASAAVAGASLSLLVSRSFRS
jgi:VIT1/CCC1 family predicted Fe2+/Mn2+ transporter